VSASTGPYAAHGRGDPQARIYRWSDGRWEAVSGELRAMAYAFAWWNGRPFAGPARQLAGPPQRWEGGNVAALVNVEPLLREQDDADQARAALERADRELIEVFCAKEQDRAKRVVAADDRRDAADNAACVVSDDRASAAATFAHRLFDLAAALAVRIPWRELFVAARRRLAACLQSFVDDADACGQELRDLGAQGRHARALREQ